MIKLNKILCDRLEELYEVDSHKWLDRYITCLYNSLMSYWNNDEIDKSVYYAKKIKSVCEENDITSDYYDSALRVLDKQSIDRSSQLTQEYNENLTTLLLIAKGLSHRLNYNDITPSELLNALRYVDLNTQATGIFPQIFGQEEMNNLKPIYNGNEIIGLGVFMPSLDYKGALEILCHFGRITTTQGKTHEDRDRCRAVC